jgi:hypothetical protein
MDIGPALTLGFVWLLFSILSGKKKDREAPRRKPPQDPDPRGAPQTQLPLPLSPRVGRDAHPDPTQREGLRLETLLRELAQTLDQSSGPLGRAPDVRLPGSDESVEGPSLEISPQVESLDVPAVGKERLPVDQDDEAEQVVARRIAAAEARSGPLTQADHSTFDQRIRQEPADHTATRGFTVGRLRQAVVWREILGPPLGLRDPSGRDA